MEIIFIVFDLKFRFSKGIGTLFLMTGEQRFRCKLNEAAFTDLQGCLVSFAQKHKGRSLSKLRNVRILYEKHIDAIRDVAVPVQWGSL